MGLDNDYRSVPEKNKFAERYAAEHNHHPNLHQEDGFLPTNGLKTALLALFRFAHHEPLFPGRVPLAPAYMGRKRQGGAPSNASALRAKGCCRSKSLILRSIMRVQHVAFDRTGLFDRIAAEMYRVARPNVHPH
jgi:hypothetical protein